MTQAQATTLKQDYVTTRLCHHRAVGEIKEILTQYGKTLEDSPVHRVSLHFPVRL